MPKSARRKEKKKNMQRDMCAQAKIAPFCKPEEKYGKHNGRSLSYYPVDSREWSGMGTYCGGGIDATSARGIFDELGEPEQEKLRQEFADKMTIMENAGRVWEMIKEAPYTAAAAAEAGITAATSTFLNLGVSDGMSQEAIKKLQLENQQIEDYYNRKIFDPDGTYEEYIQNLLNERLITEGIDQHEMAGIQDFIRTGNLDSCPRIGLDRGYGRRGRKKQKKGSKKKRRRSKPKKRKSKRTNNN
jgi:hypothetical protein